MRGPISWVALAGNISRVCYISGRVQNGLGVLENAVDGAVVAAAIPPALNNPSVVAIDLEVNLGGDRR